MNKSIFQPTRQHNFFSHLSDNWIDFFANTSKKNPDFLAWQIFSKGPLRVKGVLRLFRPP